MLLVQLHKTNLRVIAHLALRLQYPCVDAKLERQDWIKRRRKCLSFAGLFAAAAILAPRILRSGPDVRAVLGSRASSWQWSSVCASTEYPTTLPPRHRVRRSRTSCWYTVLGQMVRAGGVFTTFW